ncbi:MAG: hypothetical protein K0R90_523 [Oscillospiraceae bacterium]|jgi:TM2 domain-containing membrane protein YozV|nr:hypothetical protein [Oscillospiraceae bacterium]
MYCKNCGKELFQNSAVCTHCGVPVGSGHSHCQNCAAQVDPNAVVCVYCGANLNQNPGVPANYQQKSKIAAGVLGILLGSLGIHNFYLGYTGKAVAQLLITLLTCGFGGIVTSIWGLVEGIMILTGSINVDGNNIPLKE